MIVKVPNAELKLYETKSQNPCCKDMKFVGSRRTGPNADFDFGDIRSGRYWLAVQWDGKEEVTAIDVDARNEGTCEAQEAFIEKGYFYFSRVVEAFE